MHHRILSRYPVLESWAEKLHISSTTYPNDCNTICAVNGMGQRGDRIPEEGLGELSYSSLALLKVRAWVQECFVQLGACMDHV